MVSSFPILGLVIDGAAFNLDFADAIVPLEVCHIVVGVKQTPFEITDDVDGFDVFIIIR